MKIVIDDIDYPVKEMGLEQYNIITTNDKIGDPELISIFTDVPVEKVKQAPFQDITFVAKMLRQRISQDDMESPLHLTYTFQGKDYGLIIPSKISFEEWINLEVFLAKKPLDLKLLATHLYKPLVSGTGEDRVLEPYSMEECINRSKTWGDFPMSVFVSALFFLGLFSQKLMETTLSSLEMKMTENKSKMKKLHHKK
jgi:hypothetical protein